MSARDGETAGGLPHFTPQDLPGDVNDVTLDLALSGDLPRAPANWREIRDKHGKSSPPSQPPPFPGRR